MRQHKNDESSFTSRYKCHYLMYYETHKYINNAIAREHKIKKWSRERKIQLIRAHNSNMIDLSKDWPGLPVKA